MTVLVIDVTDVPRNVIDSKNNWRYSMLIYLISRCEMRFV